MGKKTLKQKASEASYNMPILDKKALKLKKSFGEVSSILKGKKK